MLLSSPSSSHFLFLSKDGGILIWPYRQPGTHFGAMVAKDQTRG